MCGQYSGCLTLRRRLPLLLTTTTAYMTSALRTYHVLVVVPLCWETKADASHMRAAEKCAQQRSTRSVEIQAVCSSGESGMANIDKANKAEMRKQSRGTGARSAWSGVLGRRSPQEDRLGQIASTTCRIENHFRPSHACIVIHDVVILSRPPPRPILQQAG